MRVLIGIALLIRATALANPVAGSSGPPIEIFMASESLRITISPTDAVFNATFTLELNLHPADTKSLLWLIRDDANKPILITFGAKPLTTVIGGTIFEPFNPADPQGQMNMTVLNDDEPEGDVFLKLDHGMDGKKLLVALQLLVQPQ